MTKTDLLAEGIQPSFLDFLQSYLESPEFELVPLAGDASNRKYYRVVLDDRSWVLMSWEPFKDPDNYPFLSVQRHFAKHKVNVPKTVAMSPELGLVLLEDLGDLTLERKFWENQNQEVAFPFYQQAVDELIKIHYAASDDKNKTCSAFHIAFDKEKFLWEMNYGREHLFEKLLGLELSDTDRKSLQKVFSDICEKLDRQEKRISHRDYHSRNLMLKLGNMRVIDFQDARLGPVQYDLVSLLYDSYVKLAPAVRTQILNDYLSKAEDQGVKYDRSQFQEIMKLQIIQRCFKACGSFASFYNMRNDVRYLKYLQPTIKTVAGCLAEFKEYNDFLSFIVDRGVLERKYDDLCTR